MVENLAVSTGDILIYDSHMPGGERLMGHASNTTSLNKISSNSWDYVVLQGQSQETSLSQAQMEQEVYPYAESLSSTIRANYECSQPMFYMTWGRKNGEANNCQWLPWVCTYEGMDDAIKEAYLLMAETNVAEVSPAGAVWRYLRTYHPEINLYVNDGSHPSVEGSYAVACAFYTMIYKKDPTLITWNSSLSETMASNIKLATKAIVFDALSTWDFTLNPAVANFYTTAVGEEISFLNTSDDFDELLWDFGDGTTSTEINPVHNYTANGAYEVALTVFKCGKSDTKTELISVSNLNTTEFVLDNVKIFPNPISRSFTVALNKNYKAATVLVFDMLGKVLVKKTSYNLSTLNMDVSFLSPGMYMVQVHADNRFFTSKLSKK